MPTCLSAFLPACLSCLPAFFFFFHQGRRAKAKASYSVSFSLRQACDAWKKEAEESKLLVGKVEADKMMALQQRDEAAGRCASLHQELERIGVMNKHMKCLQRHEELETIPVPQV